MTTIEDNQEISNSVLSQPNGVIQQETEIVNPLSVDTDIGKLSLSHDHQTNDTRSENLQSFASKWRYYRNNLIETSSAIGVGARFYASLADYAAISTVGNPLLSTVTERNLYDFAHAGIRFDVEYKFTIYSSSQQQGALIFSYYPGMAGSGQGYSEEYERLNGPIYGSTGIDYDEDTRSNWMQIPYKIVSFGGETEVVMTIPFSTKYDFICPRTYPYTASWGHIQMKVFDPLVVKSGTYDKVHIRVERRLVDVKMIGPNFNKDVVNMGDYGVTDTQDHR